MRMETAMEFEELEPRAPKKAAKDLTPFAIAELEEYIGRLKAEIARVEAQIAAKKAQQSGAASLFKF